MKKSKRRSFIKAGLTAGAFSLIGSTSCSKEKEKTEEEKVKLLTPEGKLVEVSKSEVQYVAVSRKEARKGIPGKKFVMVVDLSRCTNARKCISSCEHHHQLTPDRPFIKVLKMQDNADSAPYWMPKKCFQCDNPPCPGFRLGKTIKFKRIESTLLPGNKHTQ